MATSDRIAVMNAGRIEQVDAPHLLYTRPRTRFVAGFVGRTNLLEARVESGTLRVQDLTIGNSAEADGPVLVSLRPQAMTIHEAQPSLPGPVFEAAITERTYLGESWDYVVQPAGSSLRLRAAAAPLEAHEVGQKVWLAVDPRQVAVVQ